MARRKIVKKDKGSFTYKDNGKVEYRITYKDEFGSTKRKSITADDEDECIRKAQDFLDEVDRRKRGIDMSATISEIVEFRLNSDYEKNHMAEQGYSRNLGTLEIIKKSPIGNIPIMELTELHMDMFLRTLTIYSNSQIEKVYRQVRMAFKVAFEKGIIERNIMLLTELRCPKSQREDKRVRGLNEEEQAIFIETIYNIKIPKNRNNYKKQLLIELFTGMRMGEINALHPEDVDFKKKVIRIRHTVSRGKDYRTFIKEGAKTYKGERDIPLNKMVEPILIEAIAEMKVNPEGLIFYDYIKGDIITTAQVNSFYKRICAKCNLEDNGQHALRHTFATRCIEAGIPPVVIKNWLGHKDIHVTLDTYADVFDRMTFESVSKLEQYIDALENLQGKTA